MIVTHPETKIGHLWLASSEEQGDNYYLDINQLHFLRGRCKGRITLSSCGRNLRPNTGERQHALILTDGRFPL
jgi:hypothetical protein